MSFGNLPDQLCFISFIDTLFHSPPPTSAGRLNLGIRVSSETGGYFGRPECPDPNQAVGLELKQIGAGRSIGEHRVVGPSTFTRI